MMDKRSRRDLLSDLPLSIIHIILALVPIRDVVKTSILSRQWRYVWTTLPDLAFDYRCASEKTSVNHFITQVVFFHKGPVHKFKLFTFEHFCIDQWLRFLSRNDIRNFIVNAEDCEDNRFKIHSSIYSCESLIHLDLINCEISPPPPTFKGFLCLRCLILDDIDVSPNTIESLVAYSPLLDELRLDHSPCHRFESSELKIRAPNLKRFYVNDNYKEICLYAPLLTKMSATLFPEHKIPACNYTKFLGGLTNLEELSGSCLTKYLSIGVESCHNSPVFDHLKVINISAVRFDKDAKQIWVVVRLITGAPNLQKLQINCWFPSKDASDLASISFWDSEFTPNFRFERLKVIKINNVHGFLNEMKLVKFLLASSPMLETLSFQSSRLTEYKLRNLMTELLSYRRASTNAQILFSVGFYV